MVVFPAPVAPTNANFLPAIASKVIFVPFQYGNKLQEKIALHSQSHFNITCENDQAAILLAKSGYGVAILPEFCIPANSKDLITLPIANEDYRIDYGIAYHKAPKIDYIKYFINNFHLKMFVIGAAVDAQDSAKGHDEIKAHVLNSIQSLAE